MAEKPIIQNLRDFTVQIRHTKTGAIVGTGVAISLDGKIVTCAHVVVAAGVNPRLGKEIPGKWEMVVKSIFKGKYSPPIEEEGAEVGVYFPRAMEEKERRAKVVAFFADHDDDLVLLQVVGEAGLLAPEQVPVLGKGDLSEGNPFRSYGYRPLDKFDAGWTDGKIMGSVERPKDAILLAEPIQLDSKHINGGMSGAAVLDTKRNVVVGVISMAYFADKFGKDRDTAWAVDAKVVGFEPLNVPIYEGEFWERKAASKPSDEIMSQAEAAIGEELSLSANRGPEAPSEWAGRSELLEQLDGDWSDAGTKVTGLIGFGGEGKSSIAAKWIEELLKNEDVERPDGVFWWSFYDRKSVDEFFEGALSYLSGENKELLRGTKSPSARAHLIAGMLYRGRYLFVLDGLEVMQEQEGDRYGEFISGDLREFLEYFSSPGHSSFCLITSRAPVIDLIDYTSYVHRDVTRMSEGEGCELLRNVGVEKGTDDELKDAVNLWDGHALTLGLIGAYLAEAHDGDISHLGEIEPPTADEPRYDRVARILRRYDEHLTKDERAFLQVFSAFRTPVKETAFDKVFRKITRKSALFGVGKKDLWATEKPTSGLTKPIAALDDAEFEALINRLQSYRILRYNPQEKHYTTHPLIRAHYFGLVNKRTSGQRQKMHEQIKDYYLSVAGDVTEYPTLEDLIPLIEAVHHGCQAGAYDEAGKIQQRRLDQMDRHVVIHQLGACETQLEIIKDFFPNGDTSQEPQVSDPKGKNWILNEVGLCLMDMGRLSEAVVFYERAVNGLLKREDWGQVSLCYGNLAQLYAYLGRLAKSAATGEKTLQFARRAEDKESECNALSRQALGSHLRGDIEAAGAGFQEAEVLEREIYPGKRYLHALRGIFHADHLQRVREADYARRVTEANLEICNRNHWAFQISMCCRILGDLAADTGDHESAGEHYGEALKIARSITKRDVLIEALLGHGRWMARYGEEIEKGGGGFSDLNEVLGYSVQGGYRIYEADIRVGLAWAHVAAGDTGKARAEAERALTMSEEMGYYWGKKDATELLEK